MIFLYIHEIKRFNRYILNALWEVTLGVENFILALIKAFEFNEVEKIII